jgi:hypothetical protein
MHPDTDVRRPADQEVRAIARGKLIKTRTKQKKQQRKKRTRRSAPMWAALDDPDAYSIDEFCRRHMISRPTYIRLRTNGKGPREIKFDQKVLITKEAAADWRREREAASAVAAE